MKNTSSREKQESQREYSHFLQNISMWIRMGAGSKPMIHLQISDEEIALLNINKP